MMPGPLTTLAIVDAGRCGYKTGPILTLGHGVVEGALVVAIGFGLGGVLQHRLVLGWIATAGAVILLWMAYGMIAGARRQEITLEVRGDQECSLHRTPLLSGSAATLSNPYWYLWWATIGAGYISFSQGAGWVGLTAFFTGHIAADLVWLSLVSSMMVAGRRFLSDVVYRRIVVVLAVFLIFLSTSFFYLGVTRIISS